MCCYFIRMLQKRIGKTFKRKAFIRRNQRTDIELVSLLNETARPYINNFLAACIFEVEDGVTNERGAYSRLYKTE